MTEQTDAAEDVVLPRMPRSVTRHVMMTPEELAARETAAEARGAERALREAAEELRHQGSLRFDAHGPRDPRGAALWDAGCHIDPDDGNALAAQVAPSRVPGEGS